MKLIPWILALIFVYSNAGAYGQWSTFHFTDEWGDKTDDLGARSANTKAARTLGFPYHDRTMVLIVDDCHTAWIRFNDNMNFGRLGGFKVRVDGGEIEEVSADESSRSRDLILYNGRRLISLLGGASRVEFLIPLYDRSPARFNLNMSGSMRAVGQVCSREMLDSIAQSERRAQAREDSLRRARQAREDSIAQIRRRDRIRRDSIAQSKAQAMEQARTKRSRFCERDFVVAAIENQHILYPFRSKSNLVVNRSKRMILDKSAWDLWSPEEKRKVALGVLALHACVTKILLPEGDNKLYMYSRRGLTPLAYLDVETNELTYQHEGVYKTYPMQ